MPDAVAEGELLWTPSRERIAAAPLTRYMRWLDEKRGRGFSGYDEMWRWSTTDVESFWASVWDYFDIMSDSPYGRVLSGHDMPGATWFDGARVNFAEHVLRNESTDGDRPALHFQSEDGPIGTLSWRELGRQVRAVATSLRERGIEPGDRVASYLPNVPHAVIAMLATAAIGAVWCSAPPEFGVRSALDRFQQLEPKVLLVPDGYRFGGSAHFRGAEAQQILDGLTTVQHAVWVPIIGQGSAGPAFGLSWSDLLGDNPPDAREFRYERVAHDAALWVLFSSGTTGPPKAIVHSHIGILMELLKLAHLHTGLTPESTTLFYTTTGWMMWNFLVGCLLTGGSIVLYDGSPTHPSPEVLWRLAERVSATCLGLSPSYLMSVKKLGLVPQDAVDLTRLQTLLLSGSPCTPETYDWVYRNVKHDLWVDSVAGGTELCGAFLGGAETLPVYAGEMQARMLGMDVHSWSDDGRELIGEVGELVCATPSPSMPLRLWGDADGALYRETYFSTFPGVWRHGDFLKLNERGGCYIYGRSDATLNRHGVRIGTAEIYRTVEQIEEVADSLVVCLELSGGRYFMPLFVQLQPGVRLDDALRDRVVTRLRHDCSPRHVPDRIYEVEQIPYTLTGKKMEVPVRRILAGRPPSQVASRDAMRNPDSLHHFVRFADGLSDDESRSVSTARKDG